MKMVRFDFMFSKIIYILLIPPSLYMYFIYLLQRISDQFKGLSDQQQKDTKG